MFETLTMEALLSLATVSLSALSLVFILLALRSSRLVLEDIDIEVTVRNAPYHRLHNIIRTDPS